MTGEFTRGEATPEKVMAAATDKLSMSETSKTGLISTPPRCAHI